MPPHPPQRVFLCRDRARCKEDPVNLGFYRTLRVSRVPSLQNLLRVSLRHAHGDANDYHYIMNWGVRRNETRQNRDAPTFGSTVRGMLIQLQMHKRVKLGFSRELLFTSC